MRRRDHELDILRSEPASTDTGGFMEEVKVEVVSLKKKKRATGWGSLGDERGCRAQRLRSRR